MTGMLVRSLFSLLAVLTLGAAAHAQPVAPPTAYGLKFEGLTTAEIPLQAYAGKVILVVNTASQCGYTRQYDGLQKLYTELAPQGLVIIGVPSNDFGGQEPGSAKQIAQFCRMNFGVTFPMAAKSVVTGAQAHPFYRWALGTLGPSAAPQWNFHKILIGRDGRAIAAFPSAVTPDSPVLRARIQAALRS